MKDKLIMKEYNPIDNLSAWGELHRKSFGEIESDDKRANYIQWLYENPVGDNFYIGAFIENKLVGFLAFLIQKISGFNQNYVSGVAVSAFTDPSFQGMGIYSRLVSKGFEIAIQKNIDFCSGYTNSKKVLALELKIGWDKVSEGVVLAFPLNYSKILHRQFPKLKRFSVLARPIDHLSKWYLNKKIIVSKDSSIQCNKINEFIADYDILAELNAKEKQYMPHKDSKYLQWKYLSPFHVFKYQIIEARKDDQLCGCIIGRPMKMKGLNGYAIIDIIIRPGSENVINILIRKILNGQDLTEKYDIIATMISKSNVVYAELKKMKFWSTNQTFDFIFHLTGNKTDDAVLLNNTWFHSWGNTDTV